MSIQEILVANGISLVLLFILIICRHMTRRTRRTAEHVFTALIIINIVCSIAEPFSFLVDGVDVGVLWILNFAANTVLYGCTATVSVLWVWYVALSLSHDRKRPLRVVVPMMAIWGLLISALVGNIFGGYFFSIDANNVYHREPLGYIFYAFLFSSYIISLILYYRFRIIHGKAQFFPIWMFLFPLLLGCGIQMLFYGISVAWTSCAIGLTGIYVNLQSKQSLVDDLTGVYNRAYLEHKLIMARRSARYVYSGIMLDIDDFKQVNDTFGHSIGDTALADAAKLLINITDRYTQVFRFAGDEFIVFIRLPAARAAEQEAVTRAVEERIRNESDAFNAAGEAPYTISFSMGHAVYDPTQADDAFFHAMDDAMYREKQRHHNRPTP